MKAPRPFAPFGEKKGFAAHGSIACFHAMPSLCCSFLIGLWPAFGLLTPLLLAVLFMGSSMAFHFIPSV
jgi:hypothetical protein